MVNSQSAQAQTIRGLFKIKMASDTRPQACLDR